MSTPRGATRAKIGEFMKFNPNATATHIALNFGLSVPNVIVHLRNLGYKHVRTKLNGYTHGAWVKTQPDAEPPVVVQAPEPVTRIVGKRVFPILGEHIDVLGKSLRVVAVNWSSQEDLIKVEFVLEGA